jgi:hypothetical protein
VVSMDVTAHLDDFLFFAPANGFCKWLISWLFNCSTSGLQKLTT